MLRTGGLTQAGDIFAQTLQAGREGLERFGGQQVGRDITDPAALEELRPFVEGGQLSFRDQLAQSGALGPQAQQEFFAKFTASPGQDERLKQAIRGIESAGFQLGGSGGGNVFRGVSEAATNLILEDLDKNFNRLAGITSTGLAAAGQRLAGQTNVEQLRNQQEALRAQEIASERGTLAPLTAGLAQFETGGLANIQAAIGNALAEGREDEANALALAITGGDEALAQSILGAAGVEAQGALNIGEASAAGLIAKAGAARGTIKDIAQGIGFVATGGLGGLGSKLSSGIQGAAAFFKPRPIDFGALT